MRPVHTCFRTALNRTFRSSCQSISGGWVVPEFLTPAFVQSTLCSRRAFSYAHQRYARPTKGPDRISVLQKEEQPAKDPRIPPRDRDEFKPALPEDGRRGDIQAWLAALEPLLPAHLRQNSLPNNDLQLLASAVEISRLLLEAQSSNHDILSHMALVEGRWNTVMWIMKKLVDGGPTIGTAPEVLEPFANVVWDNTSVSLKEVTNNPVWAHRVRPSKRLKQSLEEHTAAPDTLKYELKLIKSALGQVWRSLGSMILVAAEEKSETNVVIMPHVLEIIAYLHHVEMIPEAIYRYSPAWDPSTLQQPPTLHLLSSRILTSLSDATWNAHESSVQDSKERLNAQYFLGHEIPGSRYKITVPEIGPEIWVELVLWSCLHGGWILDGAAILEKILSYQGENSWSLICWRDIVNSSQASRTIQLTRDWGKLAAQFQNSGETFYSNDRGDRFLVQRTVSSEVVAAFVDGLINTMRVGVGDRGSLPEQILSHIINLKRLLDRDNLSLGSSSWDALITRFLESEGIVPEKDPKLMLKILGLAQTFGKELSSTNVISQGADARPSPTYVFDASAAPLGLLHRTIHAFIQMGNTTGALEAFQQLQKYVDNNKIRSIRDFFQALKASYSEPEALFTGNYAPIDFPGFFPHVPTSLLAKMLDLATESRMFDFGEWLLYSSEIDGPLISPRMYKSRELASSLIRHGTATRDQRLLMKIVSSVGAPGGVSGSYRLPAEVLSAFLHSQIQHHRWDSVKSIYTYVRENPGYRPRSETLAVFARELVRLRSESDEWRRSRSRRAKFIFSAFLNAWKDIIERDLYQQLNSILGVLSSVGPEWVDFCSRLWTSTGRQQLALDPENFNQILDGVVDGYGSLKGKHIVDMWCYPTTRIEFRDYRSPGGLPTMPKFKLSKGDHYDDRPPDIELSQSSGAKIRFQGRVAPNIRTMRVILRKAAEEETERGAKGTGLLLEERAEIQLMLEWAELSLRNMGLDYRDIQREFGSLVTIANLKEPPPLSLIGFDEGVEDDTL
ncbi:uncharacterized protein K441DRAFT_662732 [Cenococcum geophilum 1.58]|uniref:uncharacterized protein n=1 Tax=Cenococcum geophilum 1.58 TaxID=794803 RepID=UPI00358E6C1D|nr:hypothetical protein K441DRAFT_662732 [Cenococcum geophilum 1.58]